MVLGAKECWIFLEEERNSQPQAFNLYDGIEPCLSSLGSIETDRVSWAVGNCCTATHLIIVVHTAVTDLFKKAGFPFRELPKILNNTHLSQYSIFLTQRFCQSRKATLYLTHDEDHCFAYFCLAVYCHGSRSSCDSAVGMFLGEIQLQIIVLIFRTQSTWTETLSLALHLIKSWREYVEKVWDHTNHWWCLGNCFNRPQQR